MHTNYLGTWGKSLKTGKYLIPLAAFFFVGVAVYPGTTITVVSEQIRYLLERVLVLFHSTPLRVLLAIMFLPCMVVKGVINGSLRSLSDINPFSRESPIGLSLLLKYLPALYLLCHSYSSYHGGVSIQMGALEIMETTME